MSDPSAGDFITVLECEPGKRLSKRIHADGKVEDYDGGWLYRPESVPVESLADLAAVLEALAGDPAFCVIRGRLKDGAAAEWVPRRSRDSDEMAADFEAAAHRWVCLDLDASIVAIDPENPRAAIEAWRASLPAPLSSCGMIFKLSAKASLFPYLRGHAWVWCSAPVDDLTLRAWCAANDFDPALARAVQPHYTADPVFVEGADPYAGRRLHVFEGPDAAIDWAGAAAPARAAVTRAAPLVDADAGVLEALGDARDHEGHRWHLCGALGGVWRRQWRSVEWARATIEAWLSTVPGDHTAAVDWCLGAWGLPPEKCTGRAELELHLGGDREWAERVARASARHTATAPSMAPAVSALIGDVETPALLAAPKRQMYIRDETGYFGPVPLDLMGPTLRAVGLLNVLGVGTDGKTLRDEALYKTGAPVHTIVRNFADSATRYDGEEFTLFHGYRLPDVEPVEDGAVAAWLRALAGSDETLELLHVWITACQQRYIHRRAAALVIAGPPGVGKTLTFRALARLWGARTFVPLSDCVAQFNGTSVRSPIVCDDECAAIKARLVSSATFRTRVQASERDYELKGKEKVELYGFTREGITANDLGEVILSGHGGGVTEALRDRLLTIEVPLARGAEVRAALAAVRADGDDESELARITGHFAWIWSTVELGDDVARFAGAGGAASAVVASAGLAAEGADLWDVLARWLDGDGEPLPTAGDAARGWAWGPDGSLWACPSAIARVMALRDREWDTAKVAKLLRAVASGPAERFRTIDGRVRYFPIAFELVAPLL